MYTLLCIYVSSQHMTTSNSFINRTYKFMEQHCGRNGFHMRTYLCGTMKIIYLIITLINHFSYLRYTAVIFYAETHEEIPK